MPAKSHGQAANGKNNTFMEVPQSPANNFPAFVKLTLLRRESSPENSIMLLKSKYVQAFKSFKQITILELTPCK